MTVTTAIHPQAVDSLLAAICEQAVRDLGHRHRVLRESAADFLTNDCDSILEHLNIDAGAVRQQLREDGRL